MQDYFAHVVCVSAVSSTDKFYGNKNKLTHYLNESGNRYRMFEMDDFMGIPNDQFEDDINVFRWRYETTLALSKRIYSCWSKSKKIKSISASTRNENYTYKTTSYWYNKKKKKYETRYWVVTSNRYFYVLNT